MRIESPINQLDCHRNISQLDQLQKLPLNSYYDSTLRSSKGNSIVGSIFLCITWPIRFLGLVLTKVGIFLRNYIFPCCSCSGLEDRIDWPKTKKIFDRIYTAVITASDGDRQKRFNTELYKLSRAALNRFKEHIGLVLASRQGIKELAAQEKYMRDNWEKIRFYEDYFEKIRSDVLKEAVKNFHKEISRH